jgi:ATP-binding cassette subfamily B protein
MNPARHGAFSTEDDRQGRAFDRRLMARLLSYALPYRRGMAAAVGLILLTTALGLVGPFIVKWAIDGPLRSAIGPEGGAAGGRGPAEPASGAARGLALAVILYFSLVIVTLFLRYLQGMSMSRVGQRVIHDLRLEVFTHLQRMPIAYYDRNPVGRLTTRVTNDIDALSQLFTSGVVTFVADLLVLAGITAALIWVNVSLALTTLGVLPPLAAVTIVFRRAAQRYYREQRSHLAQLNAFSQESLQGLTVIQLFNRERETARRYREINDRYLTAFQRTVLCYSLYFPAVELIGAGALAAILWRGGAGLRAGTLTFGEFYLFWYYLGKFLTPIRDMAERYNILQSAMAAAERIFRVLDLPAPPAAPGTAIPAGGRLRGEVEFGDVWFSYEKRDPAAEVRYALRGVSFTARPGETVAIVGATGAGKSTLVNLLLKFHEPERGSIRIDGLDIAQYPPADLRRRIGLVLQDSFLFSQSIRENIRLGRPQVSSEAVIEAARRTHADRVIERLPRRMEEVLGERGAGLSSGEKQLLAFARALAGDPDILILDEATAHVDAATEALIRDGVRELLSGRTAIVIAHRLSTIRQADRIVVLHKGEVREMGTHQELLARRGIYERLYRLQLKTDLPAADRESVVPASEVWTAEGPEEPQEPEEKEIDGASRSLL